MSDSFPPADNLCASEGTNPQEPAAASSSGAGEAKSPGSSSFGSLTKKVTAGVGAIITSVCVAVVVKYSERVITGDKTPPSHPVAVVIHPPVHTANTPRPTGASAAPVPPDPVKLYNVGPPTALFNGKDLTGFYSILGDPKARGDAVHEAPLGKNNDPLKVFSVQDGMLRVSGEVYGCLLTEKEYENYLITVEYKWGELTWPPRTKYARNSGILLHCVGPDDAVRKCFPQNIRCRIQEGGRTGGFRLLTSKPYMHRLTVECEDLPIPGPTPTTIPVYKPGGPARTFQFGENIYRLGTDPAVRDRKGWQVKNDVEMAAGQWNTLECYCFGDTITIRLNGQVMNHATRSRQTKGKIGIQSYKTEIFFRRLDVIPLTKK